MAMSIAEQIARNIVDADNYWCGRHLDDESGIHEGSAPPELNEQILVRRITDAINEAIADGELTVREPSLALCGPQEGKRCRTCGAYN